MTTAPNRFFLQPEIAKKACFYRSKKHRFLRFLRSQPQPKRVSWRPFNAGLGSVFKRSDSANTSLHG